MIDWQKIIELLPAIRRTARSRAWAVRADPEEYEADMLAGILEAAARKPDFLDKPVGYICMAGVYHRCSVWAQQSKRQVYGNDDFWAIVEPRHATPFSKDDALTRVIVDGLDDPRLQELANMLASGEYTTSGNHTGQGNCIRYAALAEHFGCAQSQISFMVQKLRHALTPKPEDPTPPPDNHRDLWPDLTPAEAATATYMIGRNGTGTTLRHIRDHFNIGPTAARDRVQSLLKKGALAPKEVGTGNRSSVYEVTPDYCREEFANVATS